MKVLLYSGGMDSWLIDKLWKPDVKLYINIDGDYSYEEMARLPVDVKCVSFPLLGTFEQPDKFVPLRNLYFLMIASHYGDELCLGATAGDGSKDKSFDFLVQMESMLSYFWDDKKVSKSIRIEKRFAQMSKGDLLREYLAGGGSIERVRAETFSCYTPRDGKECGECYPCFRKFSILHANGCSYPREVREKMWNYIRTRVLPTKEEGGYVGTYYTDRGVESADLVKAVDRLREEFA